MLFKAIDLTFSRSRNNRAVMVTIVECTASRHEAVLGTGMIVKEAEFSLDNTVIPLTRYVDGRRRAYDNANGTVTIRVQSKVSEGNPIL